MIKGLIKNKTFVVIFILLAALLLIGGGYAISKFLVPTEEEPPLEEVLKDKLAAYETDIIDSLVSLDTNQNIAKYLIGWAANKEIPAKVDETGNVIFSLKASEGQEHTPPTTIVAGFNAEHMEICAKELAVAMCVAKNAKNHGPLKVLFLVEDHGIYTGALNLSADTIPEGGFIFCLGDSIKEKVSTITGGYGHFTISHKLKYEKPSYDKAYKISLSVGVSQPVNDRIDEVLNPIKTLGNLLANFKSTSLFFELVSFYGGDSEKVTPSKASMTVVINESDVEKFLQKMEEDMEEIQDTYLDDYPELSYTYEEVELPSTVIRQTDTDNLISLMYTSLDGVYTRNQDGNIVALTNMGKISTKDRHLTIEVSAMSCDETICGLCDVTYRCTESYPLFDGTLNPNTKTFFDGFKDAYLDYTGDLSMSSGDNVSFTSCSILQEKATNAPILYCGISADTKYGFAGAIITYMEQQCVKPEE